jgi:hypothetical protein
MTQTKDLRNNKKSHSEQDWARPGFKYIELYAGGGAIAFTDSAEAKERLGTQAPLS